MHLVFIARGRCLFIFLITKRGNSTCINCLASGFYIGVYKEKRREEKRREEKRREEKRREEKRREETDIHFRLFIMTDINCQWQECPHKSGVLSLKT